VGSASRHCASSARPRRADARRGAAAHGPTARAGPASRRGSAHDGERTHAPADLGRRQLREAPERQGERDRAGRLQAAPKKPTRHDHHDRTARLALVPAGERRDECRYGAALEGTPPVPLAKPVAVEAQSPSRRTHSGAAHRTSARPHLIHDRGSAIHRLTRARSVRFDSCSGRLLAQARGTTGGVLVTRFPSSRFPGPATRWCPSSPVSTPPRSVIASRRPTRWPSSPCASWIHHAACARSGRQGSSWVSGNTKMPPSFTILRLIPPIRPRHDGLEVGGPPERLVRHHRHAAQRPPALEFLAGAGLFEALDADPRPRCRCAAAPPPPRP
jgi:hypothetical protein